MTLIPSKVVLEPDQDVGLVSRLGPRVLQVEVSPLQKKTGEEPGYEATCRYTKLL